MLHAVIYGILYVIFRELSFSAYMIYLVFA